MKNKISIKKQSDRSTKWEEKVCKNANLVLGNFELGIRLSTSWGTTVENESPVIETCIDGNEYEIPLQKFKEIIKQAND